MVYMVQLGQALYIAWDWHIVHVCALVCGQTDMMGEECKLVGIMCVYCVYFMYCVCIIVPIVSDVYNKLLNSREYNYMLYIYIYTYTSTTTHIHTHTHTLLHIYTYIL